MNNLAELKLLDISFGLSNMNIVFDMPQKQILKVEKKKKKLILYVIKLRRNKKRKKALCKTNQAITSTIYQTRPLLAAELLLCWPPWFSVHPVALCWCCSGSCVLCCRYMTFWSSGYMYLWTDRKNWITRLSLDEK